MTFPVRGLEIHNARMWRWSSIESALSFMRDNDLNALILHQNDLIDSVVLPGRYVDPELMYTRWPILRSTLAANRLYMRQLLHHAGRLGIGVYFEVKELWFPDQMLELIPELRVGGSVCPTHPFWPSFLQSKIEALLAAFPDVAGVIVSPATRESKATIATRSCSCDRCSGTDPVAWYESILGSMFRPLFGAGKTLVVRDFAYSSVEQSLLVQAARAVSPDVVMALKNVPHDFWPTFPHNPAIGDSAGLRQWVEYDVLGQYCGLGVVPCALLDDVRSRLSYCAEHGVQGVWFRTDWELVNDLSVFNSLNKVNLYAGAALAADPSVSSDEIYGRWLGDGISTAMRPESLPLSPESPRDVEAVRSVMAATWPVLERAMYTRGHVFQYSSKIAPTLDDFFYVAERYHSREQWDPGSSARVQVEEANVRAVVEEKELSRRMVRELRESAEPFSWGLSEELAADIDTALELLVEYVEMYSAVVVAGFRAALALRTGRADHLEQARAAVRSLTAVREHIETAVPEGRYPHYVYWLFDTQLLRGFENDVAARLAA